MTRPIPEARKYYWQLMDKALFKIGIDAWWLDTTEPETEGQEENILLGHKLAIGSGDRYVNIYPLMTTGAVYDGQRSASDKKRVFILSRSAFAGDQRNGVTAWSGDINSDLLSFRRQIPAGLNFALSGIPYWTTDIGGFVSAGSRRSSLPRVVRALVSVRHVQSYSPRARNPQDRSERTVVVRAGSAEDSGELRPPALSHAALHLFAGLEDNQRRLHADASAGHGFPHRRAGAEHRRSVHVRPGVSGQSGDRARGHNTAALFAAVEVVRLLERIGSCRASEVSTPMLHWIACRSTSARDRFFRWGRMKNGPRKSPPTRSNCESIAARTATSRCTKTKTTTTTTKKALYATIPLHWDDAKQHAHDRRSQGPVSGHAGKPNFPRGVSWT